MDADWSVELTAEDETLEMPWRTPDSSAEWLDLRAHPEAAEGLPECRAYPELAEVLRRLNGTASGLASAKCDLFGAERTGEAQEIHGAWRFGSYVDFLFSGVGARFSLAPRNFDFAVHEGFARSFAQRLDSGRTLGNASERIKDAELEKINGDAEIIVRRCWYAATTEREQTPTSGFYFTLYLFGFGEDASTARQEWVRTLPPVINLLLGLTSELPAVPPAEAGRK